MKDQISGLIGQALQTLTEQRQWPAVEPARIRLDNSRDPEHGDFACNIALQLAKPLGLAPRDVASAIIEALPDSPLIDKAEVAGPGFINLFLSRDSANSVLVQVLDAGNGYGRGNDTGESIQVEFVSCNPTGPLHVGHGRGAAYGASVAALLQAAGHQVQREYYVNDAGRQMDILACSLWLRYLQLFHPELRFPDNGYQGDYIRDFAEELKTEHGDTLVHDPAAVTAGVCADASDGGDKEQHIDELIRNARQLLAERYDTVVEFGLQRILDDIRAELLEMGVAFDQWFSEKSLTTPVNEVDAAIRALDEAGYVDERDGALWFRSTDFGDDKDRVLRRENGLTTYFASDVAYHKNKFERGFDRVINIWGADHHGYIARVQAALKALGIDPDRLTVKLVQMVSLYRGKEQLNMSTRGGAFVALRELRQEVGDDAARFFYILRKAEQATDFDLELAKSESKDNPVYYIQYAHARVCSVMRKLAEAGQPFDRATLPQCAARLIEQPERDLIAALGRYPEVVQSAAAQLEPHSLAHYLRELAGNFHTWYNGHKVIVEDAELRNARAGLCLAVGQVIANGLQILGVSAPESM